MTREELASALAQEASDPTFMSEADLLSAAFELRKQCATCQWWNNMDGCPMGIQGTERLPSNGSGFCHEWEAKLLPIRFDGA